MARWRASPRATGCFGYSLSFALLRDIDLPSSNFVSVALYPIMEDGRYAQTFVDAGQADPAVQFFVPVVDAPLLVVEGHAPKPGRSERFLYRIHERDVLVDDPVEVGDLGLPKRMARAGSPIRGELGDVQQRPVHALRPEQDRRNAGRRNGQNDVRKLVVTGVVVTLYGRCLGYLRHADGARVDSVQAAVRGRV